MGVELDYNITKRACFVGYIVQAIVNNFAPLLFLTWQRSYGISLSKITLLVTLNFGIQFLVDIFAIELVDKIGYRTAMITAHLFSSAGLVLITILPEYMTSPFLGIVISVMFYAVGSGLLEVIINPVVEACPSENKEKTMSLLHSFYCWGHVGVVLLSTTFFFVFGIEHWKILALCWSIVPICNAVIFVKAPMKPLLGENQIGMSLHELFSTKVFWILVLMMICAGASEQAVSQWASTFAEEVFGVGKTIGDLAGPMTFAFFMGISRLFYGKYGERIHLNRFIIGSCCLCMISYLGIAMISFSPVRFLCVGLCGLSVGILWPGSISKASGLLPRGGTALYALLALGGDVGCTSGPTVVGMVSNALSNDITKGILVAAVFPVVLLICIKVLKTQ